MIYLKAVRFGAGLVLSYLGIVLGKASLLETMRPENINLTATQSVFG